MSIALVKRVMKQDYLLTITEKYIFMLGTDFFLYTHSFVDTILFMLYKESVSD